MPPEVLDKVAQRFRVLAEPTRLRILEALMDRERSVSELVARTGLGQANVSKHLGLLRSHDFVARRKDGLFTLYRIADDSVFELCAIMCGRLEESAAALSAATNHPLSSRES